MFQKEWDVLLVDDEPDVLTISRMAMRGFRIYGLPLRIRTASSKREAIELLQRVFSANLNQLAVAYVDVVMETHDAGLELCRYIREEKKNRITQLFIRTGQPGVAPERDVLARYDINGYVSKLEATEDRLYALTMGSIRQYLWSLVTSGTATLTNLMLLADSRAELIATMDEWLDAGATDARGELLDTFVFRGGFIVGDEPLVSRGGDPSAWLIVRDRLRQFDGVPLSPDGDKYVITDSDESLWYIAPRPSKGLPEVSWVTKTAFAPPEFFVKTMYYMPKVFSTAWKLTGRP